MNITTKTINTNNELKAAIKELIWHEKRQTELIESGKATDSQLQSNSRRISEYREKVERLQKELDPIMKKLEKLIDEVEGKATVRRITTGNVFDVIDEIEDYASKLGTKKDLTGTKVSVDANAQSFPNAYKYIPMSTHIVLEKVSSGWKLVTVDRRPCRTNKYSITWSEAFANNMAAYTQTVRG